MIKQPLSKDQNPEENENRDNKAVFYYNLKNWERPGFLFRPIISL
jgi:hypothetical protein